MLSHLSQLLPMIGNHFMIYSQEIRNDIIPLTNSEQIRVAPGESTPNPKAGRALGSDSSVSTGFGLPGHLIWGRALAGQGWTNRETMSPLARGVLKTAGGPTKHTHGSNGKSSWATTRNV